MIINKRSFGPVHQVFEIEKGFPACGRVEWFHEYLGNRLRHSDYESLWTKTIDTVREIPLDHLIHLNVTEMRAKDQRRHIQRVS